VARNDVYGGTLYWYAGFYPPPGRGSDFELRVLYVGSTTQWDTRHGQHRRLQRIWTELDWEDPCVLEVPSDIRLVVAEEAMRAILRPVFNQRRACAQISEAEWAEAVVFVLAGLGPWVPEDWAWRVCITRDPWTCRDGCVRPDGCPEWDW
jgi:hypothetical protein